MEKTAFQEVCEATSNARKLTTTQLRKLQAVGEANRWTEDTFYRCIAEAVIESKAHPKVIETFFVVWCEDGRCYSVGNAAMRTLGYQVDFTCIAVQNGNYGKLDNDRVLEMLQQSAN